MNLFHLKIISIQFFQKKKKLMVKSITSKQINLLTLHTRILKNKSFIQKFYLKKQFFLIEME